MTNVISLLAALSAVLAFYRPNVFWCFAACALNLAAVGFWLL